MATDAILVLEKLRCLRESDGSGHSEPYIWPVLIWIDDDTLATPDLVGVAAPALGNARVVIKDGMKARDEADIPASVGTLRVRLDDDQNIRRLVLAVALWENDETPQKAMRAGYTAFVSEMGSAIADNLFALNGATTDEDRQVIIDDITARVKVAVESAIRGGLTGGQKARIFLGTLNLDDIIDSAFKSFTELATQSFTLDFASPGTRPSNRYQITGELQAVPVRIDPCQTQVNQVRDARAVVTGVEAEIRSLQAQLRGQNDPSEPRLPKSFIVQEIARIREEDLPAAEEALQAALDALEACRNRRLAVVDRVQGTLVRR